MNDRIFSVENLSVAYTDRQGRRTSVLNGIDIEHHRARTLGVIGESGSGKSTLTRAMLRLLPPRAEVHGSIEMMGVPVMTASPRTMRELRAARIGLVLQDPRASVNPLLTIGDTLRERLRYALGIPKGQATKRAIAGLTDVGLDDPERRLRQYPHELSGGMLQRVLIAAALMGRPELVIADESTSALDVTTQADVLAMLRARQKAEGFGLVLVTHDLRLAGALCDDVVVMKSGDIVHRCAGSDLFAGVSEPYTAALTRDIAIINDGGRS